KASSLVILWGKISTMVITKCDQALKIIAGSHHIRDKAHVDDVRNHYEWSAMAKFVRGNTLNKYSRNNVMYFILAIP
ncbi:hypothetical protein D5693_19570, partial [Salmonella enterica]|nr:hypothetical protein [Salmonella enterica]